jgi:hypothetical protein
MAAANLINPRRDEARVNITWQGQNGDLVDPIPVDATDREIKAWVAEAIASGSVMGLRTDRRVNLRDFVVDRFPASRQNPFARVFVRPKTPFG